MTQTPSFYVNSPVSGTTYYANGGYRFVPGSGWTATVKAWTGSNGTGSLVSTSLTAYARDYSTSTDQNSFTGSGNTCNATGSSTSDQCVAGGKYAGSAIGSLEIYATYTGTAVVPSSVTFSPSVGGPGTSVTVSGNNFSGATGVTFNGTTASFSVTNDSAINATVPAGATAGAIAVSDPTGTGTSGATFTPSTVYVDNGAAWVVASAVEADNGAAWVAVSVYVDNGSAWIQVA